VILINLLPHREAARKRRREVFYVLLGLSAAVGVVISVAFFLWFSTAITIQQKTNAAIDAEIKVLENQIKDIAGLETEIAALRARQQAVEDLQSDRNLPVHLLTELVNQLPDGVYITKMVQADQQVSINGIAQSNERVSELLRNLANNTPWFTKPELVEIVAGMVPVTPREQRRVANFSIKVKLVRASEAEKAVPKADVAAQPVASPAPTTPVSPPVVAASATAP
jgi:type IV pilus assembly protein PilN